MLPDRIHDLRNGNTQLGQSVRFDPNPHRIITRSQYYHSTDSFETGQLIFDINASSLPAFYKERLLARADHRITQSGKIIIKCQQSRSQEMNREQALAQFIELVQSAARVAKKRVATKATYGSQQRRLEHKKQRGATKALRQGKPQI